MDKAIIVDKLVRDFVVLQKESDVRGVINSLIPSKKNTARTLKGISFTIQPGELIGFIGSNGAGKTTTLKILSGLLFPSSGFVSVMEHNPWERSPEFLKQISLVMGQKNQLWWDLPAIKTFELNKAIYEIPKKTYEDNLRELIDLLEIGKLINIPVRKLSLGQRMRMELAAALLHKPKVLFLDEPTIGLDLVDQHKMRDFIYAYNKNFGVTIILTSHNIDDLTDLVRRVIVIDEGQLLFDEALEELVGKFAKEKIIKATLSNDDNIEDLDKIGKITKLVFPEVVITVPREATAIAASELLQNFPVEKLTIEEVPIGDVVRKVFKGDTYKK